MSANDSTCRFDVSTTGCGKAQPLIAKLGHTEFNCDDCRAHATIRSMLLKAASSPETRGAVAEVLTTMGLAKYAAASTPIQHTAVCSVSHTVVAHRCFDRSCPEWINFAPMLNCLHVYKQLRFADDSASMTVHDAAVALGISDEEAQIAVNRGNETLREALLKLKRDA